MFHLRMTDEARLTPAAYVEDFLDKAEEAQALAVHTGNPWLRAFYHRQVRFWRRMADFVRENG